MVAGSCALVWWLFASVGRACDLPEAKSPMHDGDIVVVSTLPTRVRTIPLMAGKAKYVNS